MELKADKIEQIRMALLKIPSSRSYDDLLLLKSYLSRTEFIQKTLAAVANPRQMNDLCRSLGLESFGVNDAVFSQGDPGDKVYILLTGCCEVRVKYKIELGGGQSETREKLIVTYDKSGQFFGERALQFDEPRSAGVVCIAHTDLITVAKSHYLQIVNETRIEMPLGLKMEQYGTKEGVVKILSKVREKRTNQELDAVAAYLYRRVPFFQKFTMQHVVELCRVGETVTVWGRSVLFKQGQVGQAFYVILSGNVEVWVSDSPSGPGSTSYGSRARHQDVTEGLGSRVNQLVTGDCFGERALENEDSLRMASIVTGEDSTELLILSREDYNNLVFLTMQGDSAHKLKLLRKTELFRTLDSVHLQAVTKFMEPKKFQIDEHLVTAGKKAMEMIIIETGECRAITEVTEGYEKQSDEQKNHVSYHKLLEQANGAEPEPSKRSNDKQVVEHNSKLAKQRLSGIAKPDALSVSMKEVKQNDASKVAPKNIEDNEAKPPSLATLRKTLHRMNTQELVPIAKKNIIDLGRIGPNSVLASYVVLLPDVHEDVCHPETVIASSLVTAYTIGKHDLLTHLARDSYLAVVKLVQDQKKPVLSFLWENVPRMLDENQWRMEKTWEKFRTQIASDQNKNVNILHTLKHLNKMHITANSGNDHLLKMISAGKNQQVENIEEDQQHFKANVTINWGLPGSSALQLTGSSEDRQSIKPRLATLPAAAPSSLPLAEAATSLLPEGLNKKIPSKIRERLNESHLSTSALEHAAPTALHRNSLEASSQASLQNEASSVLASQQPNSLVGSSSMLNNSLRPYQKADNIAQLPFTLVQIHREYSRANPSGMVENGRRVVRSYIRLCGSFHTCAKAKELADMQMEQNFLTLFHSNAEREQELILNWCPFRGFEGVSVHDSDIFMIYCRNAPLEFSTINPSKNIFNMTFPAVCRPVNQRYAVIVANRLKTPKEVVRDTNEEDDSESIQKDQKGLAIPKEGDSGESEDEVLSRVTSRSKRKAVASSSVASSSADPSGLLDNKAMDIQSTFSSRVGTKSGVMQPVAADGKLRTWPTYLLECSVLYEVLVCASSRLEGLKYAMKRFGSMSDESLAANNQIPAREDSRAWRRKGFNNILDKDSKSNSVILTGFAKTIFLKTYNSRQPDRILKVVQQENKLICVIPLYKWILISADTFETLDFTLSFNESNIRKIFLSESIENSEEDYGLDQDGQGSNVSFLFDKETIDGPSDYRDLNEEYKQKQFDPSLVKSFSEAGLIPNYKPHKADEDLCTSKSLQVIPEQIGSPSFAEGKTELKYNDDQFMHTKAMQIFERDLSSKEMAKQVNAIEQVNLIYNAAQSEMVNEWDANVGDTCNVTADEGEQGPTSVPKASVSNYQNIVERKLSSLSQSIKNRSAVLQASDELYDQEHDTNISTKNTRQRLLQYDTDPNGAKTTAQGKRLHPQRSKEQQMNLLQRRLRVIESLQNVGKSSLLGENKVALNSFLATKKSKAALDNEEDANFKSVQSLIYSTNRAQTPVGSDNHPSLTAITNNTNTSSKYMSGQKRQQLHAGSVGPAGSAGKKLAESLKILSESLDQQRQNSALSSNNNLLNKAQ